MIYVNLERRNQKSQSHSWCKWHWWHQWGCERIKTIIQHIAAWLKENICCVVKLVVKQVEDVELTIAWLTHVCVKNDDECEEVSFCADGDRWAHFVDEKVCFSVIVDLHSVLVGLLFCSDIVIVVNDLINHNLICINQDGIEVAVKNQH